jgi:hypothetical protein
MSAQGEETVYRQYLRLGKFCLFNQDLIDPAVSQNESYWTPRNASAMIAVPVFGDE